MGGLGPNDCRDSQGCEEVGEEHRNVGTMCHETQPKVSGVLPKLTPHHCRRMVGIIGFCAVVPGSKRTDIGLGLGNGNGLVSGHSRTALSEVL